jgi:hypothetical protein
MIKRDSPVSRHIVDAIANRIIADIDIFGSKTISVNLIILKSNYRNNKEITETRSITGNNCSVIFHDIIELHYS